MLDIRIVGLLVFFASILSIFLTDLFYYTSLLSFLFLLLATVAIFFAMFFRYKAGVFLFIAIFIIWSSFMSVYLVNAQKQAQIKYALFSDLIGKQNSFVVTVAANPDKRGDKTFLKLQLCDEKGVCVYARASYFGYQDFEYGDKLYLKAVLEQIKNFNSRFNYKGFLKSKDILFLMRIDNVEKKEDSEYILKYLFRFKKTVIDSLYKIFSFNEASLAGGILLGEKRGLDNEIEDDFIYSGLMHIVVLSGYNISIVALFIFNLLFFFNRRLRAILALLAISIFVFLVGAEPPTLRAGIMGVIGFLAIALRRESDALYALLLSGILMMFWSPFAVLYDPGFQMSFAATFAIVLFSGYLADKMILIPHFFRELISSAILAYLAVTPLILFYMGNLSPLAVLANLFVLPLLPATMFFSFVSVLIQLIYPNLAFVFIVLAEFLLSAVLKIANLFGSFGISQTQISVSFVSVICFYIFYSLIIIFFGLRHFKRNQDK